MKEHAVISVVDGDYEIQPASVGAKSKVNGTSLTGRRVLTHKDRIMFGKNMVYCYFCIQMFIHYSISVTLSIELDGGRVEGRNEENYNDLVELCARKIFGIKILHAVIIIIIIYIFYDFFLSRHISSEASVVLLVDYVFAGSSHLYVFINPLKADAPPDLPDDITWEFAQKEIAQAKGFVTTGASSLSVGESIAAFIHSRYLVLL